MNRVLRLHALAPLLLLALAATGCKSTYYGFWEKFGYEKRDILVGEVKDARDEQAKAKEQFKTTLERFQELTGQSGGDLEAKYKKLKADYDRCASRADAVSKKVNDVEETGKDLFVEWDKEIAQMSNPDLQAKSKQLRSDTQVKFNELLAAMRRSEAKMKPVLTAFNDQVLFLKANLNAQAVASLQGTAVQIEGDVQQLIREMEAAIKEADEFMASMKKS
jgi:hypothetical protein